MKTILTTHRLLLREFVPEDADFILRLLNTPEWIRFIGDRNVRTLENAHQYLQNGPMTSYKKNGFGLWRVSIKDTDVPIGMCGLLKRDTLEDIDIGFALLPEFAGKNYGFEAAAATMVYAKDRLALNRIVAITLEDNVHSINLLQKIGLQFEKTIRMPGDNKPLMLFGIRM